MSSFWGDPTYTPSNKEVVKAIEQIRTLTKNSSRKGRLKTATATMHGISAFLALEYGPREVLALLDVIRADIAGSLE